MWSELDSEPAHVAFKIRIAPVPDKLCKLASHVLWDIKHAADHATYAAIRAVTDADPGDVHFPVCSHPNDLHARLNGPNSKYPVALRPLFASFEIYPTGDGYAGGNDAFVQLSKMANSTKHAIPLVASPQFQIAGARAIGKIGGARLYYPNPLEGPDGELTLGVFPEDPEAKIQFDLALYVAFGEVELFKGHAAGSVLEAFANSVESAVDQLEAQATPFSG
jgi:hypothetical protein